MDNLDQPGLVGVENTDMADDTRHQLSQKHQLQEDDINPRDAHNIIEANMRRSLSPCL
jgi:hypothetical protein